MFFLPYAKLLTAAQRLLGTESSVLEDHLEGLTDRGTIVREEIAGQDACYLARLHYCETYVANALLEMEGEPLCPPEDLDALLDRIQREQGLTYAPHAGGGGENRRPAAGDAPHRRAGHRKTTLSGAFCLCSTICSCAPPLTAPHRPGGQAAFRNLRRRGLHHPPAPGAPVRQPDGGLTFAHNEREPLDTDAVILDEASMVDLVLMQALLAALPGGCRLVLVGDPHQLPSVGPGNLLSDLLRSRRLPTLRLTEIFRQAAASAIIRGARAVDQGDCPVLVNDPAGDFFFLRRLDPAAAVETIVSLCQTRLPQNMGISRTKFRFFPHPQGHGGNRRPEPGPAGGGQSPRP